VSIERALVSAICEVIERDAIALTWLQQLPLPRIEVDSAPAWIQPYLDRNNRAAAMDHLFFDATTDLGVPTVYSLQLTPHNSNLAALVMCSTELDPATAVAKVIRESASSRIAMQAPQTLPESWDDFCAVSHGAAFMGRPQQLDCYRFLTESPHTRRLSEMSDISSGDPKSDLAGLLGRFRSRSMDVFAVDLTTDEALRSGMRVVRAIIPGLQPLSFSHRARYMGHPRLYDAPAFMGYPSRGEADINPWPQPFA
jgi:ribosomal protein S12 methylthiotransferase accessory factor